MRVVPREVAPPPLRAVVVCETCGTPVCPGIRVVGVCDFADYMYCPKCTPLLGDGTHGKAENEVRPGGGL